MLLLRDLASNTRALLDLETAATELLRLLAMALLADCSDCRIRSLPLPTNKTKTGKKIENHTETEAFIHSLLHRSFRR